MKHLSFALFILTLLLVSSSGCKQRSVSIEKGYQISDPLSMTSSSDVWFCKGYADRFFCTWSELNGRELTCRIINRSHRDVVIRRVWGGFPRAIRYKDYLGNVKTWQSGWLVDDSMGNFYMLTPQESKRLLERSSYAEFTVRIPDDCAALLAVSVNIEYLIWEDFVSSADSTDLFRKFNSHRDYVSIAL